ncbi:MAG: ATP-binding cassette domain-containing protein [Dehalococcoidia bacterium]
MSEAATATASPDGREATPSGQAVGVAVRTAGLTKRYASGTLAVDGLDLEIRRGEIFGLLGPNGAGKTTTVGMLTTRVIPTSGEAWVAGIDVRRRPVQVKRHIGVVTQSNTLDRSLTVRENLYYHGRYFGLSRSEARTEAERVLALVRLGERAKASVEELSGGMQQRLLIGRALVHGPAVLFLDEPTAGIDPQARLALWEILGELHAEGKTILLTTHYMEEAERLCQRVAIMDLGRIHALGTPDELKHSLGAETVVTVQADPASDAFVAALAGIDGVRSAERTGRGIELYAGRADGLLPRVVETAVAAGVKVRDVSVREPTLETVFIKLTGKDLRE